jgi:hypothetical protein
VAACCMRMSHPRVGVLHGMGEIPFADGKGGAIEMGVVIPRREREASRGSQTSLVGAELLLPPITRDPEGTPGRRPCWGIRPVGGTRQAPGAEHGGVRGHRDCTQETRGTGKGIASEALAEIQCGHTELSTRLQPGQLQAESIITGDPEGPLEASEEALHGPDPHSRDSMDHVQALTLSAQFGLPCRCLIPKGRFYALPHAARLVP